MGILTPTTSDPNVRLYAIIAALQDRVAALERAGTAVPIVTSTPGSTSGRPGSLAADTTHIYLNVGGGVWKATAVS